MKLVKNIKNWFLSKNFCKKKCNILSNTYICYLSFQNFLMFPFKHLHRVYANLVSIVFSEAYLSSFQFVTGMLYIHVILQKFSNFLFCNRILRLCFKTLKNQSNFVTFSISYEMKKITKLKTKVVTFWWLAK